VRRAAAAATRPAREGLHWRIWCAELAGTALLVLGALSAVAFVLGAGSPVASVLPSISARLAITGALVASVVVLIVVSPLGRLSGAHLNPAITIAFRALGRVGDRDLVGYVLAQVVGGVAGAIAFRAVWGDVARSIGGGVTHPSVPVVAALALEAGMTAALVATILVFVCDARLARWTPLAIWPVLAFVIWRFSPDTGASLNPARSAGPAVAFADFGDLWIYVLGPIAGALLGVLPWLGNATRRPVTAKLFHDRRYPCSLATQLPAPTPGHRRAPARNAATAGGTAGHRP
jgi:aquaporin Z